jgi:hypothetical protein
MDRTQNEAAMSRIEEMIRRIVEGFHPERIILFGSYARGNRGTGQRRRSPGGTARPGSRRRRCLEIREALHGMGMAKDVIVVTPEDVERDRELPGTVVRAALREGKVLYERPA